MKCGVAKQGEALTGEHRTAYFSIVNKTPDEGGFSCLRASMELRRIGFKSSEASIWKHRNNSCLCSLGVE